TVPAAPAVDDADAFQLEQDLLEELLGNRFALGDFADHQRPLGPRLLQTDKGAERIFGLLRNHRERRVTSSTYNTAARNTAHKRRSPAHLCWRAGPPRSTFPPVAR